MTSDLDLNLCFKFYMVIVIYNNSVLALQLDNRLIDPPLVDFGQGGERVSGRWERMYVTMIYLFLRT